MGGEVLQGGRAVSTLCLPGPAVCLHCMSCWSVICVCLICPIRAFVMSLFLCGEKIVNCRRDTEGMHVDRMFCKRGTDLCLGILS